MVLADASSNRMYCICHQGMDIEAAEKWIVDLIRGSKLDAKIDSRDNSVIMGGKFPSVYQQVCDTQLHLSDVVSLSTCCIFGPRQTVNPPVCL